MINKVEFSAKNLTSNAGLFLLLEPANKNGIFDLIDHGLIFDTPSTNKIKLKAYLTGCVRSGNTYTANGAAEMIKEIVAQIKTEDLKILFRMDSGYFDDEIIATIESAGCQYLIKGKAYPTLAAQVIDSSVSLCNYLFWKVTHSNTSTL